MGWRHPRNSHLALMLALVLLPARALPAQEGGKDIRRDRIEADAGPEAPHLILEPGGFTGPVGCLAFSPDGRWLAAGGDDKTVRIWEIATDRLVATLRGQAGTGALGACTAIDFSPDGRYLVVGVEDSTPEGTIRVYEMNDLTQIAQLLPGHPRGGTARLAFSKDGKYLVSAGGDKEVVIWDWATRRPVGGGAFQGRLSYLGFPWNCPVAVAFVEDNFFAWSAVDGKDLFAMDPKAADVLFQGLDQPRSFAEFVDATIATGRALARIAWPYGGRTGAKRFFPELGQVLAAGQSKVNGGDRYWVGLWSTQTGGLIQLHERHRYLISALALSPDRQLVASADLQGGVHVWKVQGGTSQSEYSASGRLIYSVAFDPSGHRLAFGFTTYGPPEWRYNHYAPLERTFDLENRRVSTDVGGPHRDVVLKTGRRVLDPLSQDPKSGVFALPCLQSGTRQPESRYTFPPRTQPMCYSFLASPHPGFADPLAIGLHNSSLSCKDPATMVTMRDFLGHQGAVTALSESPDGRFLASSSVDRTVRIWSLENFEPMANVDFDTHFDNVINYLVPGGAAARAGVRLGDRFLKMDGVDVSELTDLFLSHHWRWKVGDRVTLDLEREGKPYRTDLALVRGGDYVEPLLSLYAPTDTDWVLWTPQGYFDCSAGGDRLIGWLVNQGRSKAAQYYSVHQFRERFFRPDIIDRVLQAGDVPRAVAAAKLRHQPTAVDPRRDFEALKPPRIRILEPSSGTRTTLATVRVRAVVESPGTSPIGQITVLVNGRQTRDKDIGRAHSGTPLQQEVDQDVSLVPGHNEIAVLARNEASSETLSAMVALDFDAPKPGLGNLFVLAIGISRYSRPEINSLTYADRDALDFANAWDRQQGQLYAQVEKTVITNQNATTGNIKKGLSWLRRTATENDLAVLFLSAHGTLDDQQNYYLATEETDPGDLLATALPHTDISLALQGTRCRVLVFIDTCHSGGLVPAALGRALSDLYSEKTGAIVFSSCLPREKSFERDDWEHGAFTKALLEILKNRASDINGDGLLSLSELNQRLSDRVKELTTDHQHPVLQKPPTIREDLNIAVLGLP